MRHAIPFLVALGLVGCAPRRPPFVEPDWGNAPEPYNTEITEITREYRHCATICTYDRVVLRRDGMATRQFLTANHVDSLFYARIDSLAFIRLVDAMTSARFFHPMEGAGEHVPLAVDSYLISAASLCRRAVISYSPLAFSPYPAAPVVVLLQEAAESLHWGRCCRGAETISAR